MATNKKPDHADKGSARVPLTRQNARVLYEASFFIKLIPAYKIKLTPFLTEFPPFPFPLLLRNKESTESPTALGTRRDLENPYSVPRRFMGGDTLGLAVGSFL